VGESSPRSFGFNASQDIRGPWARLVSVVGVGGNWNNSSNAGPFYWNLNNSLGNTNLNIGARLSIVIAPTVPQHLLKNGSTKGMA